MIAQHAAGSPVRRFWANWGGGVLGEVRFLPESPGDDTGSHTDSSVVPISHLVFFPSRL